MTAAQLEEANGNIAVVDRIVSRAMSTLAKYEVHMERESWLKEAEKAEETSMVAVCQSIIRHSINMGVDPQDRKKLWLDDAESAIQHAKIETARAIYAHALTVFPAKKSIWLKAAFLEKNHGSRETLDAILRRATLTCPNAEVLWLMAAKEKWLSGDVSAAREILQEAFASNPDSEEIWLAAVKLENENSEPERAKLLLERARDRATDKPRVWMKSAKLEREQGRRAEEQAILEQVCLCLCLVGLLHAVLCVFLCVCVSCCVCMCVYVWCECVLRVVVMLCVCDVLSVCVCQGLAKFPDYDKLWLMAAQLEQEGNDYAATKKRYIQGIKHCPDCVALWLGLARLEMDAKANGGGINTARSILEKARLKNKGQELLWLEAVRVEAKAGNSKIASQLLSKGLSPDECPKSGLLWAEAIRMEQRPQRKAKSVDALKKCENDPIVIATVAKLFWDDRKIEKAKAWYNRSVTLNADNGDNWAHFYKFTVQHGTPEEVKQVEKRVLDAEPTHGLIWASISKALANARSSKVQVLKKVAAKIDC